MSAILATSAPAPITAPSPFQLSPEEAWHDPAVLALHALVFGPGRYARTAYRVREAIGHHRDLSFVARRDGRLVGAVWQTRVEMAGVPGVLLGPIAVHPDAQGEGLGMRLLAAALDRARAAGAAWVVLVGDAPYYQRFGFTPVPPGKIVWPGPVDPARVLAVVFSAEGWDRAKGPIEAVAAFAPALA